MKGTLPELITKPDLKTLNSGLRFFFSELRRASMLFRQSGRGGRAGAVKVVGATWRLVALFQQPLSEVLHIPILRLEDALLKLDEGTVSPMLRPVPHSGRASSTGGRAALRGHAAGTVARLIEANVARKEAHALVASALVELGIRPERGAGHITATTVRHLCRGRSRCQPPWRGGDRLRRHAYG
jgi:hypothetical protein